MLGILFGAGASYGSQESGSPPLGASLYDAIKGRDIGPRFQTKRLAHECLSVVEYLSAENGYQTPSITIDEWVAAISPASQDYFRRGDFEQGMSSLSTAIQSARKELQSVKGRSYMMPRDDQLDIALPEKIMRMVAVFLYQFVPSPDNLYRSLLVAMPEKSYLITLNYDCLLELAAADAHFNLKEHASVRKTLLSHPIKTLNYLQLHGGVSLCSTWNHFREGIPGLVSHSDLERINRRVRIAENLQFDLDIRSYVENLKGLAALSFYNVAKSNAIAPNRFNDFHKEYEYVVNSKLTKLIIIGCRYTPHDTHLWNPVRKFKGCIYWCGSMPATDEFIGNLIHIGNTFQEAFDDILSIARGSLET